MASKNDKKVFRDKFNVACSLYVNELERMWELNHADGYWIGEEVGGLYDNAGFITISLLDIIYCVEHDISLEEFLEYQDYNVKALDFNFHTINLKSWHMGCPRMPKESIERHEKLREEMMNIVEKEKENGRTLGSF